MNIYEVGKPPAIDLPLHTDSRLKTDFNFLFGYEGTKQANAPDGYEVLDYDYDMNDSFEFETTVYINTEPVEVSDSNQFGKVYQKTRE